MPNIFITKKQYSLLKESIQKDELLQNISSLKGNDKICDFIPIDFKNKLLEKRYNDILSIVGKQDSPKIKEISSLFTSISEKESPLKEQLEQLCYSALTETFDIPEDLISISCNLVDELNNSNSKFIISPIEDDNHEFDDVEQIDELSSEIEKRLSLNAIIIGGANILTKSILKLFKSEIDNLDSDLYNLYNKVLWLNELYLFENNLTLSDEKPQLSGNVIVSLGNDEEKTKIESKALIFPILLFEALKGFLELFIAHGLPENEGDTMYVIERADCLEYEQYSMLLGPIIWNLIMNASGNDKIDTKKIPYILTSLSEINPNSLFEILKEVFYKTKKGKESIQDIINDANNDLDYEDFQNTLAAKREKTLVTDEFINSDELLADNAGF